jgi:hypothetical protein
LKGELYVRTPKVLSLTAQATYDTYTGQFSSLSESVNVDLNPVRFNVSRQLTHNADPTTDTRYVIGGAGFKIGKWDLYSQLWRDLQLDKTVREEYRAHFKSQCWGVNFAIIKQKPGETRETQYLMKLELTGMGSGKFL